MHGTVADVLPSQARTLLGPETAINEHGGDVAEARHYGNTGHLCDEWTPAQVKAFRLMVNRSVTWADWDEELARA
jgi:hypothetical protein